MSTSSNNPGVSRGGRDTDILTVDRRELHSFFSGLLEEAMLSQKVEASDPCQHYLLDLLFEQALAPRAAEEGGEPLAVRLVHALDAAEAERFIRLRELGDEVLFLGGFFSEHLIARGLQEKYVLSLGQCAYGGAATALRRYATGPGVFDELAARFAALTRLLRHVADALCAEAASGPQDILALYERWSRSGSNAIADTLLGMGLVPTRGEPDLN